jgi:hypothetical protein
LDEDSEERIDFVEDEEKYSDIVIDIDYLYGWRFIDYCELELSELEKLIIDDFDQ